MKNKILYAVIVTIILTIIVLSVFFLRKRLKNNKKAIENFYIEVTEEFLKENSNLLIRYLNDKKNNGNEFLVNRDLSTLEPKTVEVVSKLDNESLVYIESSDSVFFIKVSNKLQSDGSLAIYSFEVSDLNNDE